MRARKRTRNQRQADENKRRIARLSRAIARFIETSTGHDTLLAAMKIEEAKQQRIKDLARKRRSDPTAELIVVVDGLGVLPIRDVPDAVIRAEYHKRVKVGRKRASYDPTYLNEYKELARTQAKRLGKKPEV